ncbi:hypothetical protein HELRODRAFT_161493 [Helobdella robusta]|uniref:CUB domain-containing protein n=1 Tax=Helobdella robusta TaxID=6412 RepID=T1ERJ7_HELRO|nr:hypothetical protein HELRODRAFT_161493 [Helobdella robusta]ESO02248.1 hypothetical protein HELRODRAFT_161493 [Helobdella robusta]
MDGSDGTFRTPNYPSPYPPNISCILFTFIGDLHELVRIQFQRFELSPPAAIQNGCTDRIRLFLDLERPEIPYDVNPNFEICGRMPANETTYFSSKRVMIVEFQSGTRLPYTFAGFQAFYTFDKQSEFGVGSKRLNSECTYSFYSGNIKAKKFKISYPATSATETSTPDTSDTISSSPSFSSSLKSSSSYSPSASHSSFLSTPTQSSLLSSPVSSSSSSHTSSSSSSSSSVYPSNAFVCQYFFYGASNERVVINFTNVHLSSSSSVLVALRTLIICPLV